jgi:hypothetical protein
MEYSKNKIPLIWLFEKILPSHPNLTIWFSLPILPHNNISVLLPIFFTIQHGRNSFKKISFTSKSPLPGLFLKITKALMTSHKENSQYVF